MYFLVIYLFNVFLKTLAGFMHHITKNILRLIHKRQDLNTKT